MNRKKIIAAFLLVILMLFAVPLIQMLFFSQQTSGKIEVDQPIRAPYIQKSNKDLFLVFFGYVGCVKVCTPRLQELSQFYDSDEFAPLKPTTGFLFINLMSEVEPDQPALFAHSFNPNFEGLYLPQKELMRIDREFNLFFSKSLSDPQEIDHSDYLYLVQRMDSGALILKNIYLTHPLNRKIIIDDIRLLQKEMK